MSDQLRLADQVIGRTVFTPAIVLFVFEWLAEANSCGLVCHFLMYFSSSPFQLILLCKNVQCTAAQKARHQDVYELKLGDSLFRARTSSENMSLSEVNGNKMFSIADSNGNTSSENMSLSEVNGNLEHFHLFLGIFLIDFVSPQFDIHFLFSTNWVPAKYRIIWISRSPVSSMIAFKQFGTILFCLCLPAFLNSAHTRLDIFFLSYQILCLSNVLCLTL